MSNCDFVARGSLGRSLIDLVASRLALRAPALKIPIGGDEPHQLQVHDASLSIAFGRFRPVCWV
jgi:hypothetical protein